MPKRRRTSIPTSLIDKVVKRHLIRGERVVALAEEVGVSRAAVHNWIAAHRRKLVERATRKGGPNYEGLDMQTLLAMRDQLTLENRRLKDRILRLMVKAGEG